MATLLGLPIVSLGLPDTRNGKRMEPSGLAVIPGTAPALLVVSDNGGYARAALPAAGSPGPVAWQVVDPPVGHAGHAEDFESVTVAGDPAWTMFGVEGYRAPAPGAALSMPSLWRFDTGPTAGVASFLRTTWTLEMPVPPSPASANQGMEGLTWLPAAAIPPVWGLVPAGTLPFLVAVQAIPSTLFVFLAPVAEPPATPGVPCAFQLDVPQPRGASELARISDLSFDGTAPVGSAAGRGPGAAGDVLYVLYDGGEHHDYLQALRLPTAGPGQGTLQRINEIEMPWRGCEGVAVHGDDLYFCVDDGKDPDKTRDGVYAVPGFVPAFVGAARPT